MRGRAALPGLEGSLFVTAISAAAPAPEPSQRELRKVIFAMVWPVAMENVLQMLIGFVNTGMVGRLGAATILAVSLAGRVSMFVWIIFGAIGTGATVLVARALGAGDREHVRAVTQQALLMALMLMGVVTAISFIFARPLLMMFKSTPDALPTGIAYLRILAFSMPFQGIYLVISAVLRGTGNTRVPFMIAVVANIVNAAINYVLIFGRLGFEPMGFRGSAIATIMAQATSAAIAVWYLLAKSDVGIRLRDRIRADAPLMRRILAIGVPSSAEMFFWQIANIFILRLINGFGTVAGAAHQIGVQAEGISYMPSAGFGIAATALVGRALGGRNTHLAQRYINQILSWGIALSVCASAVLALFPRQLMGLLTNDQAVIQLGASYLLLMSLSQIPQQISGTLGGSLRGAGDTVTSMVAATIGIWLFRVPFAFILANHFHLGIFGAWWAINLDQYVRLVIVGVRYLSGRWRSAVGDGLEKVAAE